MHFNLAAVKKKKKKKNATSNIKSDAFWNKTLAHFLIKQLSHFVTKHFNVAFCYKAF